MKKLFLIVVALIIFLVFNQSFAQDKWSLEFRPGDGVWNSDPE